MPRLNTGDEVLESLTSIDAYREQSGAHGDTLTTDVVTKGDIDAAVAAITNLSANDPIYISGTGGAELNEVASAAALLVTFKRKAVFAQDVGARIVEMVKVPLGHIAEDSAEFSGAPTVNAVPAATSKTPIAYISLGGELSFRFGLLGFNIENMQLAFGVIEDVQGIGTPTDPYQGAVGLSSPSIGLLCFRARGLRKDGSITEVDFVGCTMSGSPTENISGKTGRPIPIEGRCLAHVKRIWK